MTARMSNMAEDVGQKLRLALMSDDSGNEGQPGPQRRRGRGRGRGQGRGGRGVEPSVVCVGVGAVGVVGPLLNCMGVGDFQLRFLHIISQSTCTPNKGDVKKFDSQQCLGDLVSFFCSMLLDFECLYLACLFVKSLASQNSAALRREIKANITSQ